MSSSKIFHSAASASARAAFALAAIGVISLPLGARADQIKANNADNLELGSSWLSNTPPGASDLAIFNNTLDSTFSSFTLAADQSWLGIQVANPAAPISILGVNNLALGSGGIDLSTATVPLTLGVNISTNADQTWTASPAGSLTVSGVITTFNALSFGGGKILLNNTNTIGGAVNINSVRLVLGTAGALGTPASLSIAAGATLDLGGNSASIAVPTGSGVIDNSAAGPATLTFSAGGTLTGEIINSAGAVSLVKAGAGSLVLGTINTFSGSVTINAGALVVTNTQSLQNVSSITVAVTGGLSLADGVVLSANVITAGDSTGKEVFSDPANSSATLSGNLSAPSRQFRVSTLASSTLTLLGGISVPSNANAFFTGGNIILGGSSNLTTGVAALGVGRSSTATTLLVKDNAVVTPAAGLILANSGGANPSVSLTLQDNAFINLKTHTLDLNGSGSVTTLNLNGGSITAGSFVKSSLTAASTVNLNGGTLIAGDPSTNFIPNAAGLTVTIGTGGAKLDSAGSDLTIASPIGAVPDDGGFTKAGVGVLTFTGALNYRGVTTINGGAVNFSGAITHNIGAVQGSSVQIDFGTIVVVGTSSGVSKLSSLAIAGSPGAWSGKLDLTNNPLVIEADNDTDKASDLATLADQIASGRNGGLWNGPGITSSTVAANPSQYTLELFDNALTPSRTLFDRIPVDAESILVVPVAFGDANFDGKVDGGDLNILLTNYNQPNTGWAQGNFLGSVTVDGGDLNLLLSNFNLNSGSSAGAVVSAITSQPVPEPTSLALIPLGVGALVVRRRKH